VWDCGKAEPVAVTGVLTCKSPSSVPGLEAADEIFFEGSFDQIKPNDDYGGDVRMFTHDNAGSKCGLEWGGAKLNERKDGFDAEFYDREAKWDCKGSADPFTLKQGWPRRSGGGHSSWRTAAFLQPLSAAFFGLVVDPKKGIVVRSLFCSRVGSSRSRAASSTGGHGRLKVQEHTSRPRSTTAYSRSIFSRSGRGAGDDVVT